MTIQHKKKTISREGVVNTAITAIINGIIVGIVVLIITMSWQQKLSFSYIKHEINEADNLNLYVACHIKYIFGEKTGISLLNYETQAYKENFSTLNKQPELTKNAIRENIELMEASNKMINLLLEQPEKRNEYAPKLIDNADKVIENLDVYNEQIIEGECAD